jgi:hypothetical protein
LGVDYLPTVIPFDGGNEVIRAASMVKTFHVQAIRDDAASGADREVPEFQCVLTERDDRIRGPGAVVAFRESTGGPKPD